MTIYADYAATTPLCPRARAAMLDCMENLYGNPSSLHTPGRQAKDRLEEAREAIAACLGAEPREIYFTSGGTEADNWAISAGASLGNRTGKRRIVTTAMEHHAVLRPVERQRESGFQVTLLEPGRDGRILPESLQAALEEDAALVSVMYVNNEVGTVQPIAELGALCRSAGVLFHSDAVQAVGHIPVNVERDKVDMLSLSAHKFGGPRGVGALYVRQGVPLEPLLIGGAQERGFRAGTENLPAIVGMQAALEEAIAKLEENARWVCALRQRLVEGLAAIPDSIIPGDMEHSAPGILNVCFSGIRGESLLLLLDRAGVCASGGAACTSGALEPSHVLLSMGIPAEQAKGALRLSLGPENTEEEVESIIRTVTETVHYLRNL